jgi:hypothetical protein
MEFPSAPFGRSETTKRGWTQPFAQHFAQRNMIVADRPKADRCDRQLCSIEKT